MSGSKLSFLPYQVIRTSAVCRSHPQSMIHCLLISDESSASLITYGILILPCTTSEIHLNGDSYLLISRMQAAAEEIAKAHPEGIDVLINNAGISGKNRTRPIEQ